MTWDYNNWYSVFISNMCIHSQAVMFKIQSSRDFMDFGTVNVHLIADIYMKITSCYELCILLRLYVYM